MTPDLQTNKKPLTFLKCFGNYIIETKDQKITPDLQTKKSFKPLTFF